MHKAALQSALERLSRSGKLRANSAAAKWAEALGPRGPQGDDGLRVATLLSGSWVPISRARHVCSVSLCSDMVKALAWLLVNHSSRGFLGASFGLLRRMCVESGDAPVQLSALGEYCKQSPTNIYEKMAWPNLSALGSPLSLREPLATHGGARGRALFMAGGEPFFMKGATAQPYNYCLWV